jgi:hypothetical protein
MARIGASLLAACIAGPAAAAIITFPGGQATVRGVEVDEKLDRGEGPTINPDRVRRTSGVAQSQITVPLNQNTGDEFRTDVRQADSTDAYIDYEGSWFTDSIFNTEYEGQTIIGFDVTNTGAPQSLSYTFEIGGELNVLGGGVDPDNPFRSNVYGGGVKVRHLVTLVDLSGGTSQILSDRTLEFWTYFTGDEDPQLQFGQRNEGYAVEFGPIRESSGDEGRITIGHQATITRESYTVSLGEFGTDVTKVLGVQMFMEVINGPETEVVAIFEDPGGFAGRITAADAAAVPLPAAGWMLLAGLGGLAAVGRPRRVRQTAAARTP